MSTCPTCAHTVSPWSRFCIQCGTKLHPDESADETPDSATPRPPSPGDLNLSILYLMVALLVIALIVPPWEASPSHPPAFLGFHTFWSPPEDGTERGVISGGLLTIELATIAVAGIYFSWLFRKQ